MKLPEKLIRPNVVVSWRNWLRFGLVTQGMLTRRWEFAHSAWQTPQRTSSHCYELHCCVYGCRQYKAGTVLISFQNLTPTMLLFISLSCTILLSLVVMEDVPSLSKCGTCQVTTNGHSFFAAGAIMRYSWFILLGKFILHLVNGLSSWICSKMIQSVVYTKSIWWKTVTKHAFGSLW